MLLAWLDSNSIRANRKVEFTLKLITKPCVRPSAPLCREEEGEALKKRGKKGPPLLFSSTVPRYQDVCGGAEEPVQGRGGRSSHRFSLLSTVSGEVGLQSTEILFQLRRTLARTGSVVKETSALQPNLSGNGAKERESMDRPIHPSSVLSHDCDEILG